MRIVWEMFQLLAFILCLHEGVMNDRLLNHQAYAKLSLQRSRSLVLIVGSLFAATKCLFMDLLTHQRQQHPG